MNQGLVGGYQLGEPVCCIRGTNAVEIGPDSQQPALASMAPNPGDPAEDQTLTRGASGLTVDLEVAKSSLMAVQW